MKNKRVWKTLSNLGQTGNFSIYRAKVCVLVEGASRKEMTKKKKKKKKKMKFKKMSAENGEFDEECA